MKRIKTLKLNYEFKNVLTKGKYFIGKQVIIYFYKNKFDYNRLGIAVSNKVGKAVVRNRLKRIIRAAYLNNDIKFNNFYDIVFILNKKCEIEDISFKEIDKDIKNFISKNDGKI